MPLPSKKKVAAATDPARVRARSRGALLGLAVGDALGATLEGKRLSAPPFPTLAEGTHTEMRGGGPFQVRPGQVTDDTQMACCLAEVLKALRRYEAAEALRRYLAWKAVATDVGVQTRAVLEALESGVHPERAARELWLSHGRQEAGNGSLMRTAPLGVFFSRDGRARIQASLEDSALTHADPRCQLACVALNASLAAAIQSVEPPRPGKLVEAALTDLSIGAPSLGQMAPQDVLQVTEAIQFLKDDLSAAQQNDPMLYGPELHLYDQQGYVRVAFRLAYWELFHAPSFQAALLDVVNRGGDSDTNGAITGALLGSVYGEEAIPAHWRILVLEALSNSRGPLAERYHPNQLLTLVE